MNHEGTGDIKVRLSLCICFCSSSAQHSSSIAKQSSQDKWHTHCDRDGDPTTYGTGCVHTHAHRHTHTHTHKHTHTHTHTQTQTPCGTTARPATRTFSESDGQISNRRLLTKRLSPWQEKCVQLWVVEFTAARWGWGWGVELFVHSHIWLLSLTIPVFGSQSQTYFSLYKIRLSMCWHCPSCVCVRVVCERKTWQGGDVL